MSFVDVYVARMLAKKMLVNAGMPVVARDVLLLADDLTSVATKQDWADGIEAAQRELERRIGGLVNLPSYMACLRV